MSQYVRDQWGNAEGFPRGPVYAISQTADGYLWIGTQAGLIRFDGFRFLLIENRLRLSGSSVLGLAPDIDGSLWLGLRDTTLLRYRNGDLEDPFPGARSIANVTAMARSHGGGLLAAWLQNGAFTSRGAGLETVAPATGMPRSPVISIAQTGGDDVWLGTRGAGLYRLHNHETVPLLDGLPDPKINCLLPDGDNGLWIGTDSGVARWNGSEITTKDIPSPLQKLQILALTKDRDRNLWLGTDSGKLLRMNAGKISALPLFESEPGDAVTALYEDREGNLWIGSDGRLQRLRDSPFVTYSDPEDVPTDGSDPVFVDEQQRVWFSPNNGGLWWLKNGQHGRVEKAGLDSDIVYSIAGGPNELWVGRQRGGLTRLTWEKGSIAARTFTTRDGLAQNSVYSVYRDHVGAIWAGTLSGGVSVWNRGVFTTYTSAGGLASNTVASILQTTDEGMWFATPNGLSSFSQGRWRTFAARDGLPSENVNCLFEDSSYILWAGTTSGLAFRTSARFVVPAHLPASLKEGIMGLSQDRFGSLWIATENHVLRVNRAKLLSGSLAEGDLREYGLADGLRGVEGVKRHRSVVQDSLGRIWFSMNRGISVVDPARLRLSSTPSIPHIQTLSADGIPIRMNTSVHVPAGRQRLTVGYAGLSLSVPGRVRYRYKLEGFDRQWSEPVSGREAVFTNLGPGGYRFRLIASNPDGVWSVMEASLPFDVNPAYWQTWWFRGVFVSVALFAAFALYRLRLQRLTAGLNMRFEERLSERTRIARELHDTLLQGFLSASMQVHVAANRLPADSQVKPSLTRALDLMRQVIDEGRNAVRGLRSTHSASMDLEDAFARVPDELLHLLDGEPSPERPEFRVVSEGPRKALHPVLRDEVYRIGREALVNAFRHAKAGRIEIELNYTPKLLRVLVRDDGCGIEPQTLQDGRDGHWGLSGMRERADKIGGRLRLWSSVNGGTEIELTVPGNVAFQSRADTIPETAS